MTSIGDDGDDLHNKIIAEILKNMYRWVHRTKDNGASTFITRSAKKNYGRDSRQGVITLH